MENAFLLGGFRLKTSFFQRILKSPKLSRYYVTIITVSDRARQLIRNPQTFYKVVHRALGFKEQAPNVLRPTKKLLPNTKIGNFVLKLEKMEDFFHKCEDTIKIDKTLIDNFNSVSSKFNYS
jgi:hypothetical protein